MRSPFVYQGTTRYNAPLSAPVDDVVGLRWQILSQDENDETFLTDDNMTIECEDQLLNGYLKGGLSSVDQVCFAARLEK